MSRTDFGKALKQAVSALSPFMQSKLRQPAKGEPVKGGEACNVTRVNPNIDLRDPDSQERDRLIRHLQKVEEWFNHYLALKGIPLSVSTNPIQRTVNGAEGRGEQYKFVQTWRKYGHQPGFLYENNVKNFVDVLDHVLTSGKSISAIGGTQAGKTNFEVMWLFLGAAAFVRTSAAVLNGEIDRPLVYFPIISGPPHKNLGKQSQNAMRNLFGLYGRMIFLSTDAKKLRLTVTAQEFFKQYLDIEPTFFEENVLARTRGEADIDLPNKFVRRSSKKAMDGLLKFLQDRVLDGKDADGNPRTDRSRFRYEFILIVDEAHHGAMDDEEHENVSLLSACLQADLMYDGHLRSLADIVSDPNTLSRVILASATNWLTENEELKGKFTEFRLPLGDDYHGPNVFNCEYIDEARVKGGTKPNYGGFSKLAELTKAPFFVHFDPKAYYNLEDFRRKRDMEGEGFPKNQPEYQLKCNEVLAKVIRWITIDSGLMSGHAVIRLCNDNEITKHIAQNVQSYVPEVDILSWTGDKAGDRTARDFIIDHEKKSKKPIVMLVTGRARMGDDFPGTVRHSIEFAHRITTLTALDQGLLGRMCGYGKFWKDAPDGYKPDGKDGKYKTRTKDGRLQLGVGNFVWLNDEEAANANAHIGSKANPMMTGRKPHAATRTEGFKQAHLRETAGVGYNLDHERITQWLNHTNEIVAEILRHDKVQGDAAIGSGQMQYRPENFAKMGVFTANNAHYIPLFKDFDPTDIIHCSPELSNKIMAVDRLYLYGPEDVLDGTMVKDIGAAYDLDPASGYVRASFEWDQALDSLSGQDNHPGKYGAKDTTTRWLCTHNVINGSPVNISSDSIFKIDGSNSSNDIFCKKVAELLMSELDHNKSIDDQLGNRRKGKRRFFPIRKLAQQCGVSLPAFLNKYHSDDETGDIAFTLQDVGKAENRRKGRTEGGLSRSFRGEIYFNLRSTDNKWNFSSIVMKAPPAIAETNKTAFVELIIKMVRVEVDDPDPTKTKIVHAWRACDYWKVSGVIFRCRKPKVEEIRERVNVVPHKGFTKQMIDEVI